MYHILVVEDDRNTNQVICEFLKDAGYHAVAAYDGEDAIIKFYGTKYDLIVLDIMLPEKNGMEVLKEIRSLSHVPVIMLTALGDEYTQIKSFDLQADEYVTKPFSPAVLVKRVAALLRRSYPVDKTTVCFEDIVVDFSAYTVSKNGKEIPVTTKEIEILKALFEHAGKVLSRTQILDAVWSFDSDISDRIVDTHIKNLRKKLETDAIHTVKGVGYKFEVTK
ncbi:MAG: response regulator transcription factor [Clostridium sp.]|nr:response regulator transcription factor [Clostridium sp.]MCM1398546.1 response regulator transcription factor [Clostridium sp.]MCM1459834.1 response regulator transcription factor [Bacteroides sp.]